MDNLCTACLSKDRQLYKLQNLHTIYYTLVPGVEINLPEVQLCWECRCMLRRCHQFQRNVLAARDILVAHFFNPNVDTFGFGVELPLQTESFSKLTKTAPKHEDFTISYDKPSEPTDLEPSDSKSKEINPTVTTTNEEIKQIDSVKVEMLPDDEDCMDTMDIEQPFTPAPIEDPLSDVPSPAFTEVNIKPLQILNKETTTKQPLVVNKVVASPVVTKKLIPVQKLPGTSKTLKKIQIPPHVAKQLQLLASSSTKPVQVRIGNSSEFKNLVLVKKGDVPPLVSVASENKVEVKEEETKEEEKKEVKPKMKVVKRKVKTNVAVKAKSELLKKKLLSRLRKKPPPPPAQDDDPTPSVDATYQRFSNMLRTSLPEDHRNHVRVLVMTDDEMNERRDEMRLEPQFVNSQWKCETCIIGYYSEQQLEDHNKAKHFVRELELVCPVCRAYIPEHMYSFHYGRHRVSYVCLLCDEKLYEPKRVKEHMRAHNKVETTEFRCNVCQKVFNSKHRRKVHKEKEHAPVEEYTCEVCGKTFDRRWSWKDHVKRHNIPNDPVECHVCHKTYKNSITFAMHYRNVHKRATGEKVRCEQCDMQFVNATCLNMHLKYSRKHADPANFKHICYSCGKGFMFERQMKDHIDYVHTGRTDHVCKYCSKMYSSAGGLRKHMKFVHEGGKYEKNKVCTICGKSFTAAALRQHMNIHNNTRPYQCKVCATSFKNHGALYTHYKLKHLKLKKEDKICIRNLGKEGQRVMTYDPPPTSSLMMAQEPLD
ncbi:zinc finger protein 62 homolog isoform X3 [Plutella xylostella]|uniref:zinc finger protein 62 homolog isoform X3 n=1 Tax=Plutella xylostella TaxID=51655 RepID=UPI00203242DA|nr:zinc finger protein 62 homolog isoform X3 [Plutella xylostella]